MSSLMNERGVVGDRTIPRGGRIVPNIARIQLRFPKPVFVDECLLIVCVSADRKRTRLSVRRQQSDLAKITLVWRETVNEAAKHRSAALASQLRVEPPRRDPVRRKIADGDGAAGKLPLQVGGDRLTHAPPRCVDWLGERALAGLALLSTIVGMEWPGEYSLFTNAEIDLSDTPDGGAPDHLAFRVISTETDYALRLAVGRRDRRRWPVAIVLGQGSPEGKAYLAVQQAALALRNCEIMLAVSSKNDETNARLPFQKLPNMLLKKEHIAVFQANWIDKSTNLEAIAKAVNIGLEGLVLLDDNPAQRSQVRMALPAVAVPKVGNDPSTFAWTLLSAGYFEAVSYLAEDKRRAEKYTAESKRVAVLQKAKDFGDYLSEL
jgi:hypothetical protein